MYKMDLVLNNLQNFICLKTQANKQAIYNATEKISWNFLKQKDHNI